MRRIRRPQFHVRDIECQFRTRGFHFGHILAVIRKDNLENSSLFRCHGICRNMELTFINISYSHIRFQIVRIYRFHPDSLPYSGHRSVPYGTWIADLLSARLEPFVCLVCDLYLQLMSAT